MHGTPGELPLVRFTDEAAALRPLDGRAPFGQLRDLVRKVRPDCAIDLDTNSYSVSWRLVGETVQVVVLAGRVIVRHAGEVVADHPVCDGRRQRIASYGFRGLWTASYNVVAVGADIDLIAPPRRVRSSGRRRLVMAEIDHEVLGAMLAKGHDDGSLDKQLTQLARPTLLIIDELG